MVAEVIGPMLATHRGALEEQVTAAVAALPDLDDLTKLDTELAASTFDIDERAIAFDVRVMVEAALFAVAAHGKQ